MKKLRNMKESMVGALICGVQLLVPAVLTAVNFFVLR